MATATINAVSCAGKAARGAAFDAAAGIWLIAGIALLFTLLVSADPSLGSSFKRQELDSRLDRLARKAGGATGVSVRDLTTERQLASHRGGRPRVLASNTKLFTTAAALRKLGGPNRRLSTRVYAEGPIAGRRLRGNIYLVGDGDPALNSVKFRKAGLPHTPIKPLVKAVRKAGIRKISGRLIADDTIFDRIRGVPYSNWQPTSQLSGPLGGLTYDSAVGASDPAVAAAKVFRRKLRKGGVRVKRVSLGRLPDRLRRRPPLGASISPRLARLVKRTNQLSDNFYAEMLLKRLWARPGRRAGTTRDGARAAGRYARSLGAVASLVDGSGLSSGNSSAPREVVDLLAAMSSHPHSRAFVTSLPKAGKQGTLAARMRGTVAQKRCRAKTGTLDGVTTLSGYCTTKAGRRPLAFSILMNGVDVTRGRKLQDRMVKAIARFKP